MKMFKPTRFRKTGTKKNLILIAALSLLITGCGAASYNDRGNNIKNTENETMAEKISLSSVTINTTVRKTGQYPEEFILSFDKDLDVKELDPAAFSMEGKAHFWGSDDTRKFSCAFESATVEGSTVTLVPKDFPEKFFYVSEYKVECSDHPEFGFTDSDVTSVRTPVADDFVTVSNEDGISFDYKLFTPDNAENKPIVIVFHGYGDTSNLLTYKTAVEWAEPENQSIRPCFVLAPVIKDADYFKAPQRDKVYSALKKVLDQMIFEGKVDPDRIYVMGNSFGGMATIEFSEKYPEAVAGAMALCPALNYADSAATNLKNMVDVPIWFAHAANDNTIPVSNSRMAVKSLEDLGAKEVKYTEYSDDEMNSAGASAAPDATYSYHHVELAVMEDDSYMEWLFNK